LTRIGRWASSRFPSFFFFQREYKGEWIVKNVTDKPPLSPVLVPEASFFNGKDLTGRSGLAGYWQVQDGAIIGAPPPGKAAHTFLVSNKTYKDFDLKFEVRRKDGVGNSGVQFRSELKDQQRFTVVGPQCEIDSTTFKLPPGSLVTEPTGSPLYIKSGPEVAAKYKNAEFNEFHIRCVGKHVRIEVNGVTAIDGEYAGVSDEGVIAWQLHGAQSPREVVFRNIAFTDLSRK
jgi:hypothetical protein